MSRSRLPNELPYLNIPSKNIMYRTLIFSTCGTFFITETLDWMVGTIYNG